MALEKCGLTEDEFTVCSFFIDAIHHAAIHNLCYLNHSQAILVYTSGVYTNMGNYKGFGDSKFIPNLSIDKLDTFFKETKAFKTEAMLLKFWNQIKEDVYDLSPSKQQLGLGVKGCSTYFSQNCTSDDAENVSRYFKSIQMEGYNNRVKKTVVEGVNHYEVKIC